MKMKAFFGYDGWRKSLMEKKSGEFSKIRRRFEGVALVEKHKW